MSRSSRRVALFMALLFCFGGSAWSDVEVKTEVLVKGKGELIKMGDRVIIAYELKLGTGKLIEKTPEGKAYELEVGAPVIAPRMSEGIVGMQVGEKRRITIPPALAYGSKGSGPIPPDATLVFDLTLFGKVSDAPTATETVHDEHDGHDHAAHDDEPENLGVDGSRGRPNAQNLDKPAMFEYLIRDFFSRPWRSAEAARSLWKGNAWLTLVTLAVVLVGFLRDRGRPKMKS